VRSWQLPSGGAIRLVAVVEHAPQLFGAPYIPMLPVDWEADEARLVEGAAAMLETRAAGLRTLREDVEVETAVLRGRTASVLVDEAAAWQADLVVLGSHGFGAVERALLGSVSAEVVDHAPVPVLVARRETSRRVVVADDGSECAALAVAAAASLPIFAGAEMRVVTVAHQAWMPHIGMAPSVYGEAIRATRAEAEELLEQHAAIAERACVRLREAGHVANGHVRRGSPAREVVTAADEWADLVVIGSRGQTALARLVLGSVAHSVLLHATTSVLVVRQVKKAG
jgi:nucleotide-binding universal stress UspA family protein